MTSRGLIEISTETPNDISRLIEPSAEMPNDISVLIEISSEVEVGENEWARERRGRPL